MPRRSIWEQLNQIATPMGPRDPRLTAAAQSAGRTLAASLMGIPEDLMTSGSALARSVRAMPADLATSGRALGRSLQNLPMDLERSRLAQIAAMQGRRLPLPQAEPEDIAVDAPVDVDPNWSPQFPDASTMMGSIEDIRRGGPDTGSYDEGGLLPPELFAAAAREQPEPAAVDSTEAVEWLRRNRDRLPALRRAGITGADVREGLASRAPLTPEIEQQAQADADTAYQSGMDQSTAGMQRRLDAERASLAHTEARLGRLGPNASQQALIDRVQADGSLAPRTRAPTRWDEKMATLEERAAAAKARMNGGVLVSDRTPTIAGLMGGGASGGEIGGGGGPAGLGASARRTDEDFRRANPISDEQRQVAEAAASRRAARLASKRAAEMEWRRNGGRVLPGGPGRRQDRTPYGGAQPVPADVQDRATFNRLSRSNPRLAAEFLRANAAMGVANARGRGVGDNRSMAGMAIAAMQERGQTLRHAAQMEAEKARAAAAAGRQEEAERHNRLMEQANADYKMAQLEMQKFLAELTAKMEGRKIDAAIDPEGEKARKRAEPGVKTGPLTEEEKVNLPPKREDRERVYRIKGMTPEQIRDAEEMYTGQEASPLEPHLDEIFERPEVQNRMPPLPPGPIRKWYENWARDQIIRATRP